MSLTQFLKDRINSDEVAAKRVLMHADSGDASERTATQALRNCAARREVIDTYHEHMSEDGLTGDKGIVNAGIITGLETAIQHLAAAYSDHPDYHEDWAV